MDDFNILSLREEGASAGDIDEDSLVDFTFDGAIHHGPAASRGRKLVLELRRLVDDVLQGELPADRLRVPLQDMAARIDRALEWQRQRVHYNRDLADNAYRHAEVYQRALEEVFRMQAALETPHPVDLLGLAMAGLESAVAD